MRCKQELFQINNCFHFYNRVIGSEKLFKNDDDYIMLLTKFKKVLKEYPASIFAYCLMPNHFHFLMRQDSDKPINKIFNNLFSFYVQNFNKKYNRKGQVFQGKLQHKLITKEKYLIHLCRYIHYNPVKANLVERIENWEFSNYPEWINIRKGSLFNKELRDEYFLSISEYKDSIKDYEKYLNEKEFQNLLFDS